MSAAPEQKSQHAAVGGGATGTAANSGGLASLVPSLKIRALVGCATAGILLTLLAYLQSPRPEPLSPAGLWGWFSRPIERNAALRPSAIAGERVRLVDVTILPDGSRAWAVGDQGLAPVILTSDDGGVSWQPRLDGLSGVPKLALLLNGVQPPPTDPKAQGAAQQQTGSVSQKGDALGAAGSTMQESLGRAQTAESRAQAQLDRSASILFGIRFRPDGEFGWVTGDAGTILLTQDGGNTWSQGSLGADQDLYAIVFAADGKRGWATGSGGAFYGTDDGGQSWQAQHIPSRAAVLSAAISRDGRQAWAVTGSCVLVTTGIDGTGWSPVSSVPVDGCTKIAASDDGNVILIASRRGVFRSTDAGLHWSQVAGVPNAPIFGIMLSGDGTHAWAVGDDGAILSSTDGGGQWVSRYSDPGLPLRAVAVADSGSGIAVGMFSVLTTTDGGMTWQQQPHRRYPAPWLYFSWIGIFAIGFVSLRKPGTDVNELIDEAIAPEIGADAPATTVADDRLSFAPIVEILAKFLLNTGTKPPLTLAIDGEWGSGKTSMMRMLQGELQTLGFPTVWFNPWHHQKEDVMLAALVQHIRVEGLPSGFRPSGLRYRRRLILQRILAHPLATMLIVIGLLTPVLSFLQSHINDPFDYLEHVIRPSVDLVSALIPPQPSSVATIVDSLTDLDLWLTVSFFFAVFFLVNGLRSFPLSPAALLATISASFSARGAQDQTDYRRRFGANFAMVTAALTPRPMVIFIDDLDRCLPEKALEALESTNYLASNGGCFIVLGMARARVERLIGLASERLAAEMAETEGGEYRRAQKEADLQRELRRGYARRYLEKLVQLNVRVPNSDAQQLIGLLDAKRAAPKTGAQRNPADSLKRAGFIGALIVVPTLSIAIAYLVAWIHIAPESAPVLDVTSLWQPSAPAAALVAPSTNTNQTVPVGQGGSGSGETPPAQGPSPADSIQSAQPSGSVQSYWPILVLAGLLGYLCYRALDTGESVIPESPAFSTALGDWNGVVVSRQRSPRSVKLFGNLARYTAMMLLEPDERHKVAQQRPRFGPGKKTPTAVDPDRAAAIRESRRRDSIAVALAAIYHVRPDILDRNVSVLGHDWRKALDDVRREDMERYDQRIAEVWALLRSRTGALGADQPTIIPSSDELRAAEAQAMADPDLREELFRLRSRREATEVIAAILLKIEGQLKNRYGAWPPPEDILQRFRLFVMGTVQIERPDERTSA